MNYNLFPLPRKSSFAILDVGSYRVACMLVSIKGGALKVLAISQVDSRGIDGGAISNFARAKQSIMLALEQAEKIAEESIDSVYVNVANCGLKSRSIVSGIDMVGKNITENDIVHLMRQITEKLDELIVQVIPLEYHIDGIQEVSNPIGMYGNRLTVNAHVLTANKTLILNLEHCLNQCNVQLKHCFFSSSTSGIASLTEDEKELGVAIVDMGGSYVSIGVFKKGNLCAADVINVGGIHITRDLASGLGVSLVNAEKIKRIYGSATVNNDTDINFNTISDSVNDLNISPSDIVDIIRPRIEEILELVYFKIAKHKVGTVVISGGGSKIWGIEEVAKEVLGTNVRSGYLTRNIENFEDNYNPSLASSMGLAVMLMEASGSENIIAKKEGIFSKIMNFMKNI